MKNLFTATLNIWPVLRHKWRALLLLPLLNIVFVLAFWQSQIIQYNASTSGILFMWLVAGLAFVLIQMSLTMDAWRKAAHSLERGAKRLEALWALGSQLFVFGLACVYNTIVLAQLILLGVAPNKPFDVVIGIILAATGFAAFAYYRRRITSPASRLLLATGTKAAPQWLQAVWFALQGSQGMHIATISAIAAMGTTRFLLTRNGLAQFRDANTIAAHKAAFRDLASIIAMAVGWVVGQL